MAVVRMIRGTRVGGRGAGWHVLLGQYMDGLALSCVLAAAVLVGEDDARQKLPPTFLEFRLDSNQMRRSTSDKSLGTLGGREGPSAQPTNRRLILPPARQYY